MVGGESKFAEDGYSVQNCYSWTWDALPPLSTPLTGRTIMEITSRIIANGRHKKSNAAINRGLKRNVFYAEIYFAALSSTQNAVHVAVFTAKRIIMPLNRGSVDGWTHS